MCFFKCRESKCLLTCIVMYNYSEGFYGFALEDVSSIVEGQIEVNLVAYVTFDVLSPDYLWRVSHSKIVGYKINLRLC